MRILAIGDIHIKSDNVKIINLLKTKIVSYIEKNTIDIIVILGDVLDTHEKIHSELMNVAYDFIHELKKHNSVYVLVGNHDYVNNQQFLTNKHWMNAMKEWTNVTIVDSVIKYNDLVFCPYVPNGRFIEALNTINDWKKSKCIFAHQEFKSCNMGNYISEHGDVWNKTFPMVISGHIHDSHKVGDNIYYTGSSIQTSFDTSDKNTIAVITIKDNINIEEINFNLPRKEVKYIDINELKSYEHIETKNSVKLKLEGTNEEFRSIKNTKKYKDLIKSGVKIVFKQKLDSLVSNKSINCINFSSLLKETVKERNDLILTELYEEITLSK